MNLKYIVCFAAVLSLVSIVYGAFVFAKKPVNLETLKGYKDILPWKAEDILAFQKTAQAKDGTFSFDSYLVMDQPPFNKDAEKYKKDLEKFKEKCVKKGTVPFKIMANIDLLQKKDNKRVKITKDKTDIYIIGETDKKAVLKAKVDNLKLCPT